MVPCGLCFVDVVHGGFFHNQISVSIIGWNCQGTSNISNTAAESMFDANGVLEMCSRDHSDVNSSYAAVLSMTTTGDTIGCPIWRHLIDSIRVDGHWNLRFLGPVNQAACSINSVRGYPMARHRWLLLAIRCRTFERTGEQDGGKHGGSHAAQFCVRWSRGFFVLKFNCSNRLLVIKNDRPVATVLFFSSTLF